MKLSKDEIQKLIDGVKPKMDSIVWVEKFITLAEELLALREETRWISVDERLPEYGIPVFIYTSSEEIAQARYKNEDWHVFNGEKPIKVGEFAFTVTHWKPRPRKPWKLE